MGLLEQIFAAGVIGAGGAGFPTHKKLVTAEMLIVNAVECEPLLASDRLVMRRNATEIIAGLQLIAAEFGIPEVLIGTKEHYHEEIAALQSAIDASGAGNIRIAPVPSFYPAGDEQTLIFTLTGKTVPPGGIPLALGIVVSNVTTILNIFYAAQGTAVTRRYVTVNGEVAHPVILDVPVGTAPSDLIAAAGGVTVQDYTLVRGGPMMGRQFPATAAASVGYGKADGGLLVLRNDNPAVKLLAKPQERVVAEAKSICIQCRLCTDLCPRYLIGHQMRPHRVMRSVGGGTNPEDLLDALLCCECGICELFSCPMGLSPRQMNIIVKGKLREAGVRAADQEIYPDHQQFFAERNISQSRFIERLQLGSYPNRVTEVLIFEPSRVQIPTRHGVGKPSTPVVQVGDRVSVGDLIAEVSPDDLGCLVHASIAGEVTGVSAEYITIERRG